MIPAEAAEDLADSAAETPAGAALRATGKNMEQKLRDLVDRLRKAERERLVSVILYGSAAGGNHHDGVLRSERAVRADAGYAGRTGRRRTDLSNGGARKAIPRLYC